MKNEIHMGKIIQDKMKEDGRSVLWLAKKLNCDRTNIYKIFRKTNIDIHQLLRISIILTFDFFIYCSEVFNENMKDK
jgi:plasmid maintenance system antidote protein VapI